MKASPKSYFTLLALALSLVVATQAKGAVIIWGTPTNVNVNDATQVSTAGTLFAAESLYGDQTATPLTVYGVNFTNTSAITIPLYGYLQYGSTTSGISYQTLLAGGMYVTNAASSAGGYQIHASGLTSGQAYQVQLWTPYWAGFYDTRFSNNAPTSASDAHATPESALLTLGNGPIPPQYILGTFTASGTTQDIYYYGNNGYGVIGAIQLRAVPEPTTITLLTFGVLGLVVRHRFRQRELIA